MVVVFAMASVAGAGLNSHSGVNGKYDHLKAYVPDTLLSAIQQNPQQTFDVIVQGDPKQIAHGLIQKLLANKSGSSDENVQSGNVKQEYTSIDGAQLSLTGKQILRIAKNGIAQSITSNETVTMAGPPLLDSNGQLWPWATGAPVDWTKTAPDAATIAIVDSGIDASRSDFGNRVIAQANDIDDPLRLRRGAALSIPRLDQ